MRAKAIELFMNVEPLQQQRELLLQAILIHLCLQLREALLQLGAHAGLYLGQAPADHRDKAVETLAALIQHLA